MSLPQICSCSSSRGDDLTRPFHQDSQDSERLFLYPERHTAFPQLHCVAVQFVDSELEFAMHPITPVSVTLHQEEVWQLTTKLVRNIVSPHVELEKNPRE